MKGPAINSHFTITDVPGVLVGHVTLISGDGPLVKGKGPVRTGMTGIQGNSVRSLPKKEVQDFLREHALLK